MSRPAVTKAVRGVVTSPVHCRRCGYNLYGLGADGTCPECGLEVWETILHTVDPAGSRLPGIRNPRAVGNALLGLMICLVLGGLVLVVRPVATWVDALDRSGLRDFAAWAPVELTYLAGVAAVGAIWAVVRLAPPVGGERGGDVWRDIWLLGAGLAGWAVLVAASAALTLAAVPGWVVGLVWLGVAAAAVVALLGLGGVLRIIGLRSREYRMAQGGRQGIRAMVAAIIGITVGQVMRLAGDVLDAGQLKTIGVVITAISSLMVLIGLLYLVVNAWWIRRSLKSPPPRLDQILRPEGQ